MSAKGQSGNAAEIKVSLYELETLGGIADWLDAATRTFGEFRHYDPDDMVVVLPPSVAKDIARSLRLVGVAQLSVSNRTVQD